MEQRGLRLKLVGTTNTEFNFTDDVITIGRGEDNMVTLTDPRVSSLHGRLVRKGDGYVYEDLGSTNGSMVRTRAGIDVVVEPIKNPAVPIQSGDELMLGDVTHPIRLKVLEFIKGEAQPSGVDSRRSIKNVGQLGTALVHNPLTSRRVLHNLFEMFGELSAIQERTKAVDRLLDFVLVTLREAALCGIYRVDGEGQISVEALRTRDEQAPQVPSGQMLRSIFRAAFDDEVSLLTDNMAGLERAFGRRDPSLRTAIVTPLIYEGKIVGLLFVASSNILTQFDLDLLTVIAHQASTSLANITLIDKLSEAEARLRTENIYLKEVLTRSEISVQIIGDAPALKRTIKQVEIVARTATTVLLLGETGTGKELFARYLHEAGPRRDRLFAAVNCGALAETLLESELFGHKKGAFTGAFADRKGLFEVSDGGTLFLDEIGDVSPSLQVKLLRALESGDVTPVGAVRPIRVDVRIVAATNKDLGREVESGRFREDLYYRINVFPVNLPPLRDRVGDVPVLADFFLHRFNARLNKRVSGIAPAALERLRAYGWAGNVRELQNEMERAVLLSEDGQDIAPEVLSERISGMLELPVEIGPLKETMARLEEQYVVRALKEHEWNRTHTAKTLGISRQALTVKLSRYGVIGND